MNKYLHWQFEGDWLWFCFDIMINNKWDTWSALFQVAITCFKLCFQMAILSQSANFLLPLTSLWTKTILKFSSYQARISGNTLVLPEMIKIIKIQNNFMPGELSCFVCQEVHKPMMTSANFGLFQVAFCFSYCFCFDHYITIWKEDKMRWIHITALFGQTCK